MKKKSGNLSIEDVLEGDQQNASSADDIFNALEKGVNGAISEKPSTTMKKATSGKSPDNSSSSEVSGDGVDWKKRYSDSTREAQKMKAKLGELEPLDPLMTLMKKDPGLIPHIQNYLSGKAAPSAPAQEKASPKSVAEEMKLDEDFIFDPHEAVTDPDSDSAKVMNAMVDRQLKTKLSMYAAQQKKKLMAGKTAEHLKKVESEFKTRHNMTDEEFNEFKAKAQKHQMTMDDAYYLVNKDKSNSKIAKASKEDTLRQMRDVRNIPQSNSSVNSAQGAHVSEASKVLGILKDMDSGEDLFG